MSGAHERAKERAQALPAGERLQSAPDSRWQLPYHVKADDGVGGFELRFEPQAHPTPPHPIPAFPFNSMAFPIHVMVFPD